MTSIVRQTNLAQTIDLAADLARYDECAKKLLTYKAVAAWILKSCTKEFSQYSIRFICENCLKSDIEISSRAVHQDQTDHTGPLDGNERIDSLNSEANAIKDQTVYYDIRFRAYIPSIGEPVQLIINLEIQLNDTPGYPLVTRGFYYCARMISEQYGTVFTNEHYEKLQKVYSIWICPDPAKKRRNGIFRYHTVQDAVLGKPYESPDSYDLMEVVIVNLGDADRESDLEILDLLNTLFSFSLSSETKKKRLQEDFDIAMTEEFESEVQDMCNLGKALVDQGIEQGIEQGIKQGIEQGIEQGVEKKNLSLAKMMLRDKEPVDKIERYTGYATEKLKEIAESIGITLSA